MNESDSSRRVVGANRMSAPAAMAASEITLRYARFPDDADTVRHLFREYAAEIAVDLCFQGFEEELQSLPGAYASPGGTVFLAESGGRTLGCVAVRPFQHKGCGCGAGEDAGTSKNADACEMKRLYVRPIGRGLHCGRKLAEAVVADAREMGYRRMLLDTLDSMTAARGLYRSLGFLEIPAYYANPLAGVVYMELPL